MSKATVYVGVALPHDADAADAAMTEAVKTAVEGSSPYVVLVEKGTFASGAKAPAIPGADHLSSPEDALIATAEAVGNDAAIVSTTGNVVDVAAVARARGYAFATSTEDVNDIAARVAELRQHGGPSFLELKVRPGNRDGIGRPTRTPAEAKQSFMTALR